MATVGRYWPTVRGRRAIPVGEAPERAQLIGGGVACLGMAAIGSERLAGESFGLFLLVFLASFFWGAGKADMFAFTSDRALLRRRRCFFCRLQSTGPDR